MRSVILEELNVIEQRHGIKVLYACESGSRAWGFSTYVSDYDVRFIYIHKPDWYLSIDEKPDVIEQTMSDQLDISGWDIRKALKLFRKSNPSLIEWLNTNMVYSKDSPFVNTLNLMLPRVFSEKAALYHYFNMARKNYEHWQKANKQDVKWYFNIIRPILCCKWIEAYHISPPTSFIKLMEILPSETIFLKVQYLLEERKSSDAKVKSISQENAIDDYIEQELGETEEILKHATDSEANITDQLNILFRETLKRAWD